MNRTQVRLAAFDCLDKRKANRPTQIQNDRLRAGEPMYYYCGICGWLAAILHEEHMCPVPRVCWDCAWMIERGWLAPL